MSSTPKATILDNLKLKAISPNTLKLYLANLERLNNNSPIKNLNFLKDQSTILEKIKDYKPNTQRTYIISIVSLLKQEPKQKKLYDEYYKILVKFNDDLKTNNTKTPSQTDNWIDQSEVLKIYQSLKTEVMDSIKDKKKINEAEYNKLLEYVILSLYTLQPPRRNKDYQELNIVKNYTKDEGLDKSLNYLDLANNSFFFNNYKTEKTYKTQEVKVSDELQDVIKFYLKYHPQKGEIKKKNSNVPFLVNFEGEPLKSNNAITRVLNKIFDKKIGVSLMRSIYLTDKYKDKIQDLNNDVKDMGTSATTAQNNYIKIDDKK
jgi:hypothetical protein